MINKAIIALTRLPPSLNVLFSEHWSYRKDLQDRFMEQVFAVWQEQGRKVFLKPVKITYVLSFSSKRQRDRDNYIGGTKIITDALKKTFLFRDDAEWIVGIEIRFINGNEGTVVIIEEAGSDDA